QSKTAAGDAHRAAGGQTEGNRGERRPEGAGYRAPARAEDGHRLDDPRGRPGRLEGRTGTGRGPRRCGGRLMRILDWRERPAGGRRVIAFSEADGNGESWVYAACRSAGACESLFETLWNQGWRTLARKAPAALWLERSE